jgi:hypothetical protein
MILFTPLNFLLLLLSQLLAIESLTIALISSPAFATINFTMAGAGQLPITALQFEYSGLLQSDQMAADTMPVSSRRGILGISQEEIKLKIKI